MLNRVSILIVGNELLWGRVRDTNSGYLCRELAALGLPATRVLTVGDEPEAIETAFRSLREDSLLTIISGGLGPTEDDLTMECAARTLGAELVENPAAIESMERFFKSIGYEMAATNRKQALLPVGAEMLPNPRGTAPGAWDCRDGRHTILLPGVPSELEAMFEEQLRPALARRLLSGALFSHISLRTVGIGESTLQQKVQGLSAAWDRVGFSTIARPMEVEVVLTARGEDHEETESRVALAADQVQSALGQWVYHRGVEPLEQVVLDRLAARGWTLAVAESCTGGELGARITDVPGSSRVFLGGIVTYANEAKVKLLGVDPAVLERHGAVSEETAAAMAAGVAGLFGAQVAASVTGVAGPGGGTEEKPVGLAYIGVLTPELERPAVRRLMLPRDRKWIKNSAAAAALALIGKFSSREDDHG